MLLQNIVTITQIIAQKAAVIRCSLGPKPEPGKSSPHLASSCTRFFQKVPGQGQKRNAGLTYSVLAAISFRIVSLGTYTVILSFFPHFKSTVEVMFLNAVKYHL
jgi:hypothetical protein